MPQGEEEDESEWTEASVEGGEGGPQGQEVMSDV